MADKHKCAERVFSGERWDIRGHMCQLNGVVERDGKWFCRIHDPEKVKAKQEARSAKWVEEGRVAALKREIAAAEKAVVSAARAAVVRPVVIYVESLADPLADAVKHLEELEAKLNG